MADEPLSNGNYLEIGSDLTAERKLHLDQQAGELRAWGVQDRNSGRTLLWIDNAAHTWKAAVDGQSRPSASGTVSLPGFTAGASYNIEWWDTYKVTYPILRTEEQVANGNGVLELAVEGLEKDIAVKIKAAAPPENNPLQNKIYLPIVLNYTN